MTRCFMAFIVCVWLVMIILFSWTIHFQMVLLFPHVLAVTWPLSPLPGRTLFKSKTCNICQIKRTIPWRKQPQNENNITCFAFLCYACIIIYFSISFLNSPNPHPHPSTCSLHTNFYQHFPKKWSSFWKAGWYCWCIPTFSLAFTPSALAEAA